MPGDPQPPEPPSIGAAVVCAWCRAVLQEGPSPVSHGICNRCLSAWFQESTPLPLPEKRPDGA